LAFFFAYLFFCVSYVTLLLQHEQHAKILYKHPTSIMFSSADVTILVESESNIHICESIQSGIYKSKIPGNNTKLIILHASYSTNSRSVFSGEGYLHTISTPSVYSYSIFTFCNEEKIKMNTSNTTCQIEE